MLAARIERAHQRSPGKVAGNRQIITGGEDSGIDRRLDILAQTEDPDVELALRQRLAQKGALQGILAVVERDRRIPGEQRGTEALFELLLGPSLGDDWHRATGRQDGDEVDQQ